MNIFEDFDFVKWAFPSDEETTADETSRLYLQALIGLVSVDRNDEIMLDSFIFCWQQFNAQFIDIPKGTLDHLVQVCVANRKPRIEPDADMEDMDAIIYVHLAVGLALLLEKTEDGQSERFSELIDDASRIVKRRNTGSIKSLPDGCMFPLHIEKSMELMEVLIACKLFHRSFNEGKFMDALNFLKDASELAAHTDLWGFGLDDEYPFPTIGTSYSGGDLIAFLVPEQKAVDAFEFLYEENSRDTEWKQLTSHCKAFQHIYEDLATDSVSVFRVEMFSWDFWQLAHMLASQRISRDELVDVLAQMREKETETRLRLYFFGDTWDRLPDKARAALISADREYGNARGRRQGVFEDLWLATREILVETLLKSYNAFSAAQKEQREIKSFAALALALDDDKDLNDIVQDLYYDPLFEDYLREAFNEDDRTFIKGLEKRFGNLNRLRNDTVHANRPAYKQNNFERDIRETYAEFLGIGSNGILPRLMRLHSDGKARRQR